MSLPSINIVIKPGFNDCQVTVTDEEDQISQDFDSPWAAVGAALLAGALVVRMSEIHEARLQAIRERMDEEDEESETNRTKPISGSFLDDAGPLTGQDFPSGPSQAFGGAPLGAAIIDPHGETELGQLASGSVVPQDAERIIAPPADAVTPGPALTEDQIRLQKIEYQFAAARELAAAAVRTVRLPTVDINAVTRLLAGAADAFRVGARHLDGNGPWDHHAKAAQVLSEAAKTVRGHFTLVAQCDPALTAALTEIDALTY